MGAWLGHGAIDGWQNDLTGLGTDHDKTGATFYGGFCQLTDQALEALYAGDDLAQTIVNTLPEEEMLKEYFLRLGDPALEQETQAEMSKLGTTEKVVQGRSWGRLYGKAALILGADDGRPASLPLIPEAARSLDFLELVDGRYFYPVTYYEAGPKAGLPEIYVIGNPGPSTRQPYAIHESRMVLFHGVRTTRTEQIRRAFRDHSVLQAPYEVMRSFATGFKSIEVLLTDGPQAVYKMRNLGELLTSRRADLESRIKLVEQLRSVFRAIVIDEKEDFTRQNFSFSGIDGALLMLIYRLCSAAKMPATKLVGMSPGGLNATGESDHRFWNNTVAASQRTNVAPVLTRIAEVLLATKRKKVESISVEFESLWTLSPKEEAEVKKTTADTDAILIDKGIKTPEEIYLDRFSARGWRPGYSTTPEARELREFIVQSDAKKVKEGDGGLNKELLTPTAKEAIVTVNEAREAEGLGPDADSEIGEMKVAEYRAMQEAAAEVSGEAEAKEEHGIDPNPQPSGGNLPGQGPSESEGAAGKPGDKVPGSDPPAGKRNPGLPAGAPSNRRKPRA